MELQELTYIVTIAEEKSISRAADRLYMAQSSLSQFLQQFEAELGVPIFFRSSHGVRPTESGAFFIEHARQILQHYHWVQKELWDREELQGGSLTLGISSFRGSYLLPPALKQFYTKYPKIHVNIVEQNSMALEESLLGGSLDLALVALPLKRLKCESRFLRHDEVILVANRSHPVMQFAVPKESGDGWWVRLEDAAQFEFILSDYDTILGTISRRQFKEAGLEPLARNTNVTAAFAAAMAREGLGLAFTYRSCAESRPDTAYLSLAPQGIFLELGLIYPPATYRSRAALALGDMLIHCIGDQPVSSSSQKRRK